MAIRKRRANSLEVCQAMGIPKTYLTNVMSKLRQVGIVQVERGVKGGWTLGRHPKDISLFDIITAMEGTIKINRCLESDQYCSRFATENCPVRNFYIGFQDEIENTLRSVTLEYLMNSRTNETPREENLYEEA